MILPGIKPYEPSNYPNDPFRENVNPEFAVLTGIRSPLKLLLNGIGCLFEPDKFEKTKNYIQKKMEELQLDIKEAEYIKKKAEKAHNFYLNLTEKGTP